MTLAVASAVLVAALVHAAWNAVLKSGRDPVLGAALLSIGMCAAAVVVLPGLPLPHPDSWPWIAGSVVIHLGYVTLLAQAYRFGDLAPVYTVMRGLPPPFVAFAGALLAGEMLAPGAWLGVGLISAGIVVLGVRGKADRRSLALAVGAAATIATYTLLDGLGVRVSGNAASYVLWHGLLQGGLFAGAVLVTRPRALLAHARLQGGRGVLAGAASVGGYGIVLWAMTQAPIALVSSLRETSVLFAALIGALWLGEPFGRQRLLAAGLVATGAAAMQWAR